MRARWVNISVWGASPGLWRMLLDDAGESNLRAALNLIARATPGHEGETWKGADEKVPNLLRVVALDGTDLWLNPRHMAAINFENPFDYDPNAKPAALQAQACPTSQSPK